MSETLTITVDARGSFCPGPLMEVVKRMKKINAGTIIELLSSEKPPFNDLQNWATKAGHKILEIKPIEDYHAILIQKGEKKRR